MPILEAKSEAFQAFIHSLRKGKGTVFQGLPRSAPYQSSGEKGQEDQAKTPKDVNADTPPDADNLINHSSASNDEVSVDVNHYVGHVEEQLAHHVNQSEHLSPIEEETVVEGRTSNSITSTNANPPSSHHSELQVTTRSITTTGNTTQSATEASAATEVPAPTSRMPSPAPSSPQVTEGSRKPTTLLSDGAAFLQALPNAAKAFEPRMRGGQNSEASPSSSATFSNHFAADEKSENGEQATQSTPRKINGQIQDLLTGSPLPLSKTTKKFLNSPDSPSSAQANHHQPFSPLNESDTHDPWAASLHRSPDSTEPWPVKTWNPAAYGPDDDNTFEYTNNGWAVQPVPVSKSKSKTKTKGKILKAQHYSAAELVQIGQEWKKGIFDKLVELGGKGRMRVGIVREP